jgi:hypothetical protein
MPPTKFMPHCDSGRPEGTVLVGFSVGNFRSFRDPQYCGFVASFDKAHEDTHCVATDVKALPRLTRTAALFGANASGKSNLFAGLKTMRDLVLHSTTYTDEQFAAAYTPFRLSESQPQPTMFGIDLLLRGARYHYTFAYDAQSIVAESLHVHHSRKSQRWFGRQRDAAGVESWSAFSPSLHGPRELWRKGTHSKALFLTAAGRQKAPQLQDILHWFEQKLVVLSEDDDDAGASAIRLAHPALKKRVLRIFHTVDIQIDDMRVSGSDSNATVEFLHRYPGTVPVWLDFRHEAAGIQRLVHLLGPLLDAIDNGTFVAIDDFDRSLHPLIARFLLQMLHDPQSPHGTAQLMVSTHNAWLMDLDFLRRDEIWLLELDQQRASRLSSLLQLSPRKHEKVAKNYLRGSFGAIPRISLEPWAVIHPEPD